MNGLRNKVFWLLDRFKGGSIRSNLENIDALFNLDFEQLLGRNKPYLDRLLTTAVNHTEFYAAYKQFESLQDFPVVNKRIIKQNFDSITIPESVGGKRFSVSTSGSTGTPFKIYQSQEKKYRNTADTVYFASRAGFSIGDRLLYLRLWAAYYKKPAFLAWIQNVDQLDVEEIDDKFLSHFFEKLVEDKQRKGWLAYPSAFLKVCNFLDKGGYTPLKGNIQSIIAMSEPLDSYVKEKMEYYFGCPVVSRYSNVENGILAQQMLNSNDFVLNWASYYIELLDMDSDEPVKIGEPGRIVVTDLFNLSTPMIRYDTGDVAIMKIGDKGYPVFSSVQGRITDILTNTKNEIVNPFIIYNNLYRYPELEQVQLVQRSNKEYIFRINCENIFTREEEFLSFFKTYLGTDAKVNIEYVSGIPLLKSGKRKIIVNET
ncbi:phenylacetate--CoA ligase family protein [Flagellimonas nanhaiensis]|uniref:Phenylacetate--CoA ligase family protein n=1 Tax=Flagellimonas nanhaiensis TaxID=2292706 RepID=A0A371JKS0_9FLAO|nr:phenylacetate--CoA ligase family protein [Allomuricauda nanhaiensis]RDY57554.1 phenylacetate--CoA ligase family protein [Allomuricauda nanhaiensis]